LIDLQAELRKIDLAIIQGRRLDKLTRDARKAIRRAAAVRSYQRRRGKGAKRQIEEEKEDWREMGAALAARARGEEEVFEGLGGDVDVEQPEWMKLWRAWLESTALEAEE
jgi:hypothetical protein